MKYRGTRLVRAPRGHAIMSILSGCQYFSGLSEKNLLDTRIVDIKTKTGKEEDR